MTNKWAQIALGYVPKQGVVPVQNHPNYQQQYAGPSRYNGKTQVPYIPTSVLIPHK